MTVSGRDRTRTCKGFRLACFPSRCHHAWWLALPNQAVPAGLEPATVWLTASRTTVVLRHSKSRSDYSRTSRASVAQHLFRVCKLALLGTTVKRPVGLEPTRPPWRDGTLPCYVMDASRDAPGSRTRLDPLCRRAPGRPALASSCKSQRWESNPHPSPYESAAQPIELRRRQYPRQESNLIPDLRTVVCRPPHSEDSAAPGAGFEPTTYRVRACRSAS